MTMVVMDIGVVRMAMELLVMRVRMAVRLSTLPMRMVCVVDVSMGMLKRRVPVRMRMPFREMQPDPSPHEYGGDQETNRGVFPEQQEGKGRADKRSEREIGAGPGCAQVP